MATVLARALLDRAGCSPIEPLASPVRTAGEPTRAREETDMTSMAPTMGRVGGRLRLAVAGAVVLTALTMATATAAPTPMGVQADARPRSLTPGFLLDRGRYPTLEVPGATVETAPTGINNRGMIVGGARGGSPDRGFLRDAGGRITTIRFPGARSTGAQKLNDQGQLTGYSSNTTDDPREDPTAFLRDTRGRYTPIAVPGALTTTAVGINNRTQVVGQYQTPDRRFHEYVWERGRFATIDVPGATATSAFGINNRGQILFRDGDDRSPPAALCSARACSPASTPPASRPSSPLGSTTAARSSAPPTATPPPPRDGGSCWPSAPEVPSPRSTSPAPPTPSSPGSTTAA
jgi:hypothetical protein